MAPLIRSLTLLGLTIPLLAGGHLTDRSGTAAPSGGHEIITLSVAPTTEQLQRMEPGQSFTTRPLPDADVTPLGGGSYRVAVAPDEVPRRLVSPDGIVHLHLRVVDQRAGTTGSLLAPFRIATAPDGGSPGWSSLTSRAPSSAATITMTVEQHSVSGEALSRLRSAAADTFARPSSCHLSRDQREPDATVGTAYPIGGDTTDMVYSDGATTHTAFGIAVSDVDGEFHAGGARSTTDEWGAGFKRTDYNRSFRVGVTYKRYSCETAGWLNWSEWHPIAPTGRAVDHYLGEDAPKWFGCRKVSRLSYWYKQTGKNYYLSYGVKMASVIGIDLSSERAYTKAGRTTYYFNTKKRRMCGNGAPPAQAGKVREAYWR